MKILRTIIISLSILYIHTCATLANKTNDTNYSNILSVTKRMDDAREEESDAVPYKIFFLSNLAFLRESDYRYEPMGPSFIERLSILKSNLTDVKQHDMQLIQDIDTLYTQITDLERSMGTVERLLTKGMRRFILSYSKNQLRMYNLTREAHNLEKCKLSMRAELKTLDIVRATSTGELLHFIRNEFTKHNLWEDMLALIGTNRRIVKRVNTVESQKYLRETLIVIVKALTFVGICFSINSILCTGIFVMMTTVQIIVWVLVFTQMQVEDFSIGIHNL